MPNFIKKVLANVAQSFSASEKLTIRTNIGAANSEDVQTWKKFQDYTPMPTSTDNAKRITEIGPFALRYYSDNGGNLRLIIENMDIGDPHSVQVCYSSSGAIEKFNTLYFGDPQILNLEFTNSTKWFNNIRFVVDYSKVYEISLQEVSDNPNRYLFYKSNG